MNKHMKFEKIDPYVFVTKLAGFEHTKYIQGVATHSQVSADDVPMVQGKNIRNGSFVNEHEWYIKKEISDLLPRSVLNKPCILIPYVGSNLGEVGIFPCEYICHLASNVAKVELVSDKYLLDYIKYYLQSDIGQGYLFQNKQGSAQPNITMDSIRNTFIIERTIQEQHQICSVLSTIDKKVENNKKICSELEAMAKTLYDYWFVQFDFPDENGKPYRTSGGEMTWNEQLKRKIPKGWKTGTIGDLGTIVSGGTPNTSCDEYYCTDGYAWITPNDLSGNTDKMFISHGERDVTVEGIENSSAVLMPKHTVLLSTRAPIGYLAISENEVCTNQGFKSIVPDFGYSEFYIYYVLKSNIPAIAQQGVGTTFKEVSKETLSGFKIPLPPIELTERFAAHILPGCTKRKLLENECKELTKLRDWLLPMLMNGQARVE